MLFPYSARSATWYGAYKAAENLHQALWQKDLEKRFLEVNECEGLKFLPSTEVRDLRLKDLGCDANIILIREDYCFTLRELEKYRQLNAGGVVVMGHPGIGTNLLRRTWVSRTHNMQENQIFGFYLLLCLLGSGEPVALQWRKNFFFLFSQDGLEVFDWQFHRVDLPIREETLATLRFQTRQR
jgi:hypothetical protein